MSNKEGGYDVCVIADYGVGDPAFIEVNAQLRARGKDLFRSIDNIAVSSFSTLATGFWIRQIGVENGYENLAIFSNTAPRGTKEAINWEGDERQRLLYGRLKNGVPVFAISSGYNWSFIRDELEVFHDIEIPNSGSQFRSRDLYPEAAKLILSGDTSILGSELDTDSIPAVPINRIAFIDRYGNIKTTTRRSQFSSNLVNERLLLVGIGEANQIVENHLSGARSANGRVGLLPGSSGRKEDPYLELIKRGGSAAEVFGRPLVSDTTVEISFSAA
ncbi:SAM-dependent chlorinase/fluorinase [Candidatus Daviesbacteria bacterium]|nr:SAM-dependent chlorinase/fluorinase [Candidatus Daviesbacteria bacterium]